MTDPTPAPKSPAASGPNLNQLLIDLGPVLVFVVAYNVLNRIPALKDEAIYISTGVFIAATLAAIAYSWFRTRRIPPVLVVTGVLVTAFGGLTIALHDETFVKVKPTFFYGFYAVAIFGSLLVGKNIWKLLFQHIFALPDRIWTILALRWAGLFVVLAIANEFIRRTQDTDFWVNVRPVFLVAVFLFALANAPLTLKHAQDAPDPPADDPAKDEKSAV